jgi:multidrug efflux pump subunit AcrB
LGVFFAPLLLFFVLSGWYQTVNRDRLKSPGDAQSFLQLMRVVHTDDIYPTNHERTRPSSSRLFQALVVVMAVGLTTTIVLGVMLAFRSVRNRWMIVLSLVLGVAVPAAALWLGHQKAAPRPPPAGETAP